MEQALYNTVLAGMALDGKSFFYVNPLEVFPEACEKDERKRHVRPIRQKWFGCACCPPNIARIVSSFGAYIYTRNESTLYTHLYAGSEVSFALNGTAADMKLESNFPWDGEVKAVLHTEGTAKGTLAFRIPGWCRQAEIRIFRDNRIRCSCKIDSEGLAVRTEEISETCEAVSECRLEKGYLYLDGAWQDGDEIYLDFPMKVRCVVANSKVREDIGKVAFTRGPVCYCMEEADNGKNLHMLKADMEKLYKTGAECISDAVVVEKSRELGHEMCILKVPGKRISMDGSEELYHDYVPAEESEVTLTFVPYYAWNNRGEGEMSVWVRS